MCFQRLAGDPLCDECADEVVFLPRSGKVLGWCQRTVSADEKKKDQSSREEAKCVKDVAVPSRTAHRVVVGRARPCFPYVMERSTVLKLKLWLRIHHRLDWTTPATTLTAEIHECAARVKPKASKPQWLPGRLLCESLAAADRCRGTSRITRQVALPERRPNDGGGQNSIIIINMHTCTSLVGSDDSKLACILP